MTEIICVIDETSTVADARDAIADAKITGAPVMSGEAVVGVVSRSDLLRAQDDQLISEVMSEMVYAVRPEDSVMLAVRLMAERVIHRVIVVNDSGELQGVLTAMDVLTALAEGISPNDELRYVELNGEVEEPA